MIRVSGFGFRSGVWGLGFVVQGLGLRVSAHRRGSRGVEAARHARGRRAGDALVPRAQLDLLEKGGLESGVGIRSYWLGTRG